MNLEEKKEGLNLKLDAFAQIIEDDAPIAFVNQAPASGSALSVKESAGLASGRGSARPDRQYRRWRLLAVLMALLFLVVGSVFWALGWSNLPDPVVVANARATATAEAANATATALALSNLEKVDGPYNAGKSTFAAQNYRQAAQNFEEARQKQKELALTAHPDMESWLFKTYLALGDELWKSDKFSSFEEGLSYYKKAQALTGDITPAERDTGRETYLAGQLAQGDLYYNGIIAYNNHIMDRTISYLGELYSKKNDFRDAPEIYYEALISEADALAASAKLPQAYQYYYIASKLKNVPDNRYAQVKVSATEAALKQTGQPVPTVANP
ncbi:MAG TPA: hypothetical protein VH186_22060 [Chloroflexia bacterium]|nr:hypothetical protein [Chloroflexia bacterium]